MRKNLWSILALTVIASTLGCAPTPPSPTQISRSTSTPAVIPQVLTLEVVKLTSTALHTSGDTLLTGTPIPPAITQNEELFGAISLGFPLGVLAAKYMPSLRDEEGDTERRENYTQLLQISIDNLNITLDPPPVSLLSAGRGQQQYQYIESYFEQIINQTQERSNCVKYTTGLSLNSAWLILNAYQARSIDVSSLIAFKQDELTRLDQFLGLSTVASLSCKQEGYTDFSTKLSAASDEGQTWLNRLRVTSENEVVAEVENIGKSLSDWLVELSKVAGGLSTP